MITVICTQCRAQLEMDDAFAGGVCRCQYCGTIQTVPALSKLKRRQSAPAAATAPAPVTTLPPGGVAPRPHGNGAAHGNGVPSNGLDALAEAVASSSGLGRGSLRSGPAAPEPASPPTAVTTPLPSVAVDYGRPDPNGRRRMALIIGLGLLAAVLIFAAGAMIFSVRTGTVVTTPPATVPPVTPAPARPNPGEEDGGDGGDIVIPTGPHFCGVSLEGEPTVVYVLDRGQATAELFDTLKEATYRSIESLAPGQQFAIVFWSTEGDDVFYPADGGFAPANKTEVQNAQKRFAEVYAGGRADPIKAITRAAALKPSAIVLVTGKAFDLDEDLVTATRDALVGTQTKVHTFALNSDDGSKVLGDISKGTKGQSKVVTRRELRRYSD
jgi:hypothetical protein